MPWAMNVHLISNVENGVVIVALPMQRNVPSAQSLLRQNCCAGVQGPQELLGSNDDNVQDHNGPKEVSY